MNRLMHTNPAMITLLAGMALSLLPHLSHLPAWLAGLCLLMLVWRGGYELKRFPMPPRWVRTLLVFLTLGGIFASYQTLLGRNAGSAMLVSLLFIKLLETQNLRDVAVLVHLCLFTIVIGFLFSQSIFVATVMVVVILLLFTALITFHHPLEHLLQQKPHLHLSSKLFLQALPLAVVLFAFFPRLSSPLWGLPQDAFEATTGITDHMAPGMISKLSNSNEVAFRATFDSPVPSLEKLYWRGPVLWHYDGFAWTSPESERRGTRDPGLIKKAQPVTYTITLEPHNHFWMFALDLPANRPDNSQLSAEMTLLSRKQLSQPLRYTVTSYTDYLLPFDQRLPVSRYLDLPQDISPKTRELVTQLQENTQSPGQLVQRVLNYFHDNEYYYSREAPILFDDPVDEFMFDTRKGFCEHYASTFTVMMRMAGIPARVVIGYQGGEMNPLGNYMVLRQSDAHSWSEVYLPERGWVRVDPTAAIPASRIENLDDLSLIQSRRNQQAKQGEGHLFQQIWQQGRFAWDAINNRWKQWIIDYNHGQQKSLFTAFGIKEVDWKGLSIVLFTSLGLITLLFALFLFRPARTLHADPLQKYYARFLHKLRKAGVDTPRSEGALSLANRIRQLRPDLYHAVNDITRDYNQQRYAGDEISLDQFRQKISRFKPEKPTSTG